MNIEPQTGDFVVLVADSELTCHADGDDIQAIAADSKVDIPIRGWLTTTKKNSYDQIVESSFFDWEGGLAKWSGRILAHHGQRFLFGGGDSTPVGKMSRHSIVDGEGMFGSGFIYGENPPLLKRAVLEGTLSSLSIGFKIAEGGMRHDRKTKTTHLTKGILHEVSLCNVGVCDEAIFEIVHSVDTFDYSNKHQDAKRWVIIYGQRYLVNSMGEVHNV